MILKILQIGIILLGICACQKTELPTAVSTSPVKLSVNADKTIVRIGDLIVYHIRVEANSNYWIEMPRFAENLGGFIVSDWERPEPTNVYGKIIYTHSYKLETYLTGIYEIPEVTIKYGLAETTNQLTGSSIMIDVVSITDTNDLSSNDIHDIKSAVTITAQESYKWLYVIGILFFIMAAALIIKLQTNKKYVPPPVPAHEQVYIMLRQLHAKNLLAQNLLKEYFFELITILRYYISVRFEINAPDKTTEEFMLMLPTITIFSDKQKSFLKELLLNSDLIKFANAESSVDYANAAHDSVVTFIEDTRADKIKEDQNVNL